MFMKHIMMSVLLCAVAAVGFAQTTSQDWNRSAIDDGLMEKDTYCVFCTIGKSQTIKWIEICRSTTHMPCCGDVSYFDSEKHMAAVADIISLRYSKDKADEYKTDDFTLWRLSGYMPPRKHIHSIKERFDFLTRQIESFLDYEKYSQWDYNLGAWLQTDMLELRVNLLEKELLKSDGIFKEECEAFEEYMSAVYSLYDVVVYGKPGYQGSGEPMRWSEYVQDRLNMRKLALEPVLFNYSDGIVPVSNGYEEFTPDLVNQEYDGYIACLEEDEYENPLAERIAAIEQEKLKWNEWIAVRQRISSSLPAGVQEIFRQQTDMICRYNYVLQKNRNMGYGLCSESLKECMIRQDWSDERILDTKD